MELKSFSYFPSHQNFLRSYNTLERLYMTRKDDVIPLDDDDFSNAFFDCFDYLSSLSNEDVAVLKGDVDLHCKIVLFDTIKLHLLTANPSLMHIPGFRRIF